MMKLVLLIVAVLALSAVSFADDSATIDICLDADCLEPARDSITTTYGFSNECQRLPTPDGAPARSVLHDCVEDARGVVQFTYMLYNNSADCADFNGGNLEFGLETYGPSQSCMKAKLLENNRFQPVYARVVCSSSDAQSNFKNVKLQAEIPRGPVIPKANAVLIRNKAIRL